MYLVVLNVSHRAIERRKKVTTRSEGDRILETTTITFRQRRLQVTKGSNILFKMYMFVWGLVTMCNDLLDEQF